MNVLVWRKRTEMDVSQLYWRGCVNGRYACAIKKVKTNDGYYAVGVSWGHYCASVREGKQIANDCLRIHGR